MNKINANFYDTKWAVPRGCCQDVPASMAFLELYPILVFTVLWRK